MRSKKVNVRGSLRSSFKDGIFAAFMAGVTDHYATPAALFFGATVQQVGLITALPNLLSSLAQFFSVQIIYWVGGRLKLLVRLVFSQASLILCIAMLPLLEISNRVELLLIFLILAAVCGGLAGPAKPPHTAARIKKISNSSTRFEISSSGSMAIQRMSDAWEKTKRTNSLSRPPTQ